MGKQDVTSSGETMALFETAHRRSAVAEGIKYVRKKDRQAGKRQVWNMPRDDGSTSGELLG